MKKSRLLPLILPRRPTSGARPSRAPVGRGCADLGWGSHRRWRRCAGEAAASTTGVGGGGSAGRGRWACGLGSRRAVDAAAYTRPRWGRQGCVCRCTGALSRPRAACVVVTASGEQLASRRAEHREEHGLRNLPMSSASSSSLPRIGERPPLPPLIDARSSRHRP